MKSQENLVSILDHNWLSIYDCCEPSEYESINEREEALEGSEHDDHVN